MFDYPRHSFYHQFLTVGHSSRKATLLLPKLPKAIDVLCSDLTFAAPDGLTCSQGDGLAEVAASIDGVGPQLLLDAKDLVELGQTLGSCWCTSLDLASSDAHHDVGNCHVFRLTRAMRNHYTPAGGV